MVIGILIRSLQWDDNTEALAVFIALRFSNGASHSGHGGFGDCEPEAEPAFGREEGVKYLIPDLVLNRRSRIKEFKCNGFLHGILNYLEITLEEGFSAF